MEQRIGIACHFLAIIYTSGMPLYWPGWAGWKGWETGPGFVVWMDGVGGGCGYVDVSDGSWKSLISPVNPARKWTYIEARYGVLAIGWIAIHAMALIHRRTVHRGVTVPVRGGRHRLGWAFAHKEERDQSCDKGKNDYASHNTTSNGTYIGLLVWCCSSYVTCTAWRSTSWLGPRCRRLRCTLKSFSAKDVDVQIGATDRHLLVQEWD